MEKRSRIAADAKKMADAEDENQRLQEAVEGKQRGDGGLPGHDGQREEKPVAGTGDLVQRGDDNGENAENKESLGGRLHCSG